MRQNITTQGQTGYEYIILREGSALITALDDSGRERPKNRDVPDLGLSARPPCSRTSRAMRPCAGRRAAGWRARRVCKGADILTLDRRDLQHAFAERPDLWNSDVPLFRNFHQVKQEKVPFEWMREGEVLIWRDRPHWLWLIAPELAVSVVVALVIALMVWLLPQFGMRPGLDGVPDRRAGGASVCAPDHPQLFQ